MSHCMIWARIRIHNKFNVLFFQSFPTLSHFLSVSISTWTYMQSKRLMAVSVSLADVITCTGWQWQSYFVDELRLSFFLKQYYIPWPKAVTEKQNLMFHHATNRNCSGDSFVIRFWLECNDIWSLIRVIFYTFHSFLHETSLELEISRNKMSSIFQLLM